METRTRRSRRGVATRELGRHRCDSEVRSAAAMAYVSSVGNAQDNVETFKLKATQLAR